MKDAWPIIAIFGAGALIAFVSALFPTLPIRWSKGDKSWKHAIPMSVMGRVAMGLYFSYLCLWVTVGAMKPIWFVGFVAFLIGMYPIFRRDKRIHENAA
jgi:hypothetical protein